MISPHLIRPSIFAALIVLIASSHSGCASYKPKFDQHAAYFERVETQEKDGVRVSSVGLSPRESRETFGVNLTGNHILPVWIQIDNQKSDEPHFFMGRSIDPNYYTPGEAAYMAQFHVGHRFRKFIPPVLLELVRLVALPIEGILVGSANESMRQMFQSNALEYGWVPPGEVKSGFVFVPLELGTKEISVDLFTSDHPEVKDPKKNFSFFITIPGIKQDFHTKSFQKIYRPEELWETRNEEDLLSFVQNLPPCVTNQRGNKNGDPVNLVMIGSLDDLLAGFAAAKWDETEVIYWNSILKMIGSFSFKKNYRYSPVSPLFLYGRSQDIAFQKARGTINERMHLRLWMSPLTFQGRTVWVGSVSRDIGVRFTTKTWNLMTHKIDPDIDEAMIYTFSDLMYSQRIEKFKLVPGVPPAPKEAPARNLTGDEYFTTGKRFVILLSKRKYLNYPTRLGTTDSSEWIDRKNFSPTPKK